MKVQAFIPDWPGPKQHAQATANIIRPFCPVTILNNPAHYFTEQWEAARAAFTGDILLWIMADVWPPKNFGAMFTWMRQWMAGDVGVYSTNVRWCGWQYDVKKLRKYGVGVYEVPCTDMLCWAVRSDVLDLVPHVDPAVNRLGWGIDFATMAAARQLGLASVRDYGFTAIHPNATNYSFGEANAGMQAWLATLPEDVAARIREAGKLAGQVAVEETFKKPEYFPTEEELRSGI